MTVQLKDITDGGRQWYCKEVRMIDTGIISDVTEKMHYWHSRCEWRYKENTFLLYFSMTYRDFSVKSNLINSEIITFDFTFVLKNRIFLK